MRGYKDWLPVTTPGGNYKIRYLQGGYNPYNEGSHSYEIITAGDGSQLYWCRVRWWGQYTYKPSCHVRIKSEPEGIFDIDVFSLLSLEEYGFTVRGSRIWYCPVYDDANYNWIWELMSPLYSIHKFKLIVYYGSQGGPASVNWIVLVHEPV